MDNGSILTEEIEVGAELIRRFNEVVPVRVAFWLKASERTFRYLYIASDQINGGGRMEAYQELSRLTREIHSPYLDTSVIKVIGGDDPLARAAAAVADPYPGHAPIRYRGESFGMTSVDDVTIYTAPASAPV